MSLFLGNRRRDQIPANLSIQQNTNTNAYRSRIQQQQLAIRKQRSTDYLNATATTERRDYLRRGLSVGRSFENSRQKSTFLVERRKFTGADLQRQQSVSQTALNLKSRKGPLKSKYFGSISQISSHVNSCIFPGSQSTYKPSENRVVAWPSTSSLLKSLDEELSQINVALDKKTALSKTSASLSNTKSSTLNPCTNTHEILKKFDPSHDQQDLFSKRDTNKINLSIVLSQTIEATTENDVDSALESTEVQNHTSTISITKDSFSAAQRRAQFQLSRDQNSSSVIEPVEKTTPTNDANTNANGNGNIATENNLNVYPLTIQIRPPLVRAMSAPVRTPDDRSRNIIAANKRKVRRRKIISRNISDEKLESPEEQNDRGSDLENQVKAGGKKVLSRSRSVLATDVITLVSLVSSEESDSEREDNEINSVTVSTNSPIRRVPLLRKTENDPPNFQFSAREFPTIIRRGSIAPLAARIRANRPPTAPAISIFLNDSNNGVGSTMTSSVDDINSSKAHSTDRNQRSVVEKENDLLDGKTSPVENEMPVYVRTIKERECWKLFQKMSKKGVNVTYDTILRGMLTPTEFRQLQKQRELEEAKARKVEEEAAELEKIKKPVTAIERLSDALLKK